MAGPNLLSFFREPVIAPEPENCNETLYRKPGFVNTNIFVAILKFSCSWMTF